MLHRAGDREIAEVRPFARFAFAGILKLRLQTRQPINRLVALALEAIDLALQMGRGFSAAGLGCVPAFDSGRVASMASATGSLFCCASLAVSVTLRDIVNWVKAFRIT